MGIQTAMAEEKPNRIVITTASSLPARSPRQDTKERLPLSETAMKRVEAAVAEGVFSAAYGSPIGKMRLRHELSEALYSVCLWYQDIRAEYERAMEIKGTRTGAMEPRSKSEPPDVDSIRGRRQAKRDRDARRQFEAAELAALSVGRGQLNAFENVVLRDMEPDFIQKTCVINVARALIKHRQLASRQRQGRRR